MVSVKEQKRFHIFTDNIYYLSCWARKPARTLHPTSMQIFDQVRQFLGESAELNKKPLIAILGPTASGKTALSIKIAKEFNGEIISADSRQVYRYMDIGTDKIPVSMQEGVKHYLLDIISPDEEFTVADFKRMSLKIISEIHARQNIPILCGGTGLYIDAVTENFQIPQIPPQYDIRQQLAQYYEQHGANALHNLLKEKDPEAAANIHPNNVRYVIRALEINMVGGTIKKDRKGERMFHLLKIGIEWPRELLYDRINRRVDMQMERGLLNEVKTLLMKGYHEKLPAMSSLGYLDLVKHIKGDKSLADAAEDIKRNTRNYAKRQMTWFRRYGDIIWVKGEELEKAAKRLENAN
jgi:tRNA dimethylallyltransferase